MFLNRLCYSGEQAYGLKIVSDVFSYTEMESMGMQRALVSSLAVFSLMAAG